MKSRKKLDLNSIQAEARKILTFFNPDPMVIKTEIDSLIEREYLIRDEVDM